MVDTTPTIHKTVPLFIIAGPAGCGKSTIAQRISNKTAFPFIEGDDLHPPANIAKMSSGIPLADSDRWTWLDAIVSCARDVERHAPANGVVVTCSALKRAYRERMRRSLAAARLQGSGLQEYFIFCKLSQEECVRRVSRRQGHYMKPGMVAGQFNDLQAPDPDEASVHVLDVEKTISEVIDDAMAYAQRTITAVTMPAERSTVPCLSNVDYNL